MTFGSEMHKVTIERRIKDADISPEIYAEWERLKPRVLSAALAGEDQVEWVRLATARKEFGLLAERDGLWMVPYSIRDNCDLVFVRWMTPTPSPWGSPYDAP